MKKLLLLLLVFPLVFSSCSDDDKDEDGQKTIVGRWILQTVSAKAETSNKDASKDIETNLTKMHLDDYFEDRYDLNQDKTFVLYSLGDTGYEIDHKGTYEVVGKTIVFTRVGNLDDGEYTLAYTFDGDKLSLTEDDTEMISANSGNTYYDKKKYPDLEITKVLRTDGYERQK